MPPHVNLTCGGIVKAKAYQFCFQNVYEIHKHNINPYPGDLEFPVHNKVFEVHEILWHELIMLLNNMKNTDILYNINKHWK